QPLASAGDARGGVDDDAAGLDQRKEGLQREDGRGRVAAGGGDGARGGDGLPVELRDAVDEVGEQVRRLVGLLVPALIFVGVGQAKVGAEVDKGDVAGDEVRRDRLGVAVGEGGEDEVDAVQKLGRIALHLCARIGQSEVGVDRVQALPGLAVAEQADGLQIGVRGAEPEQLCADETGSSEDGGTNHEGGAYAPPCIIMQSHQKLAPTDSTSPASTLRKSPRSVLTYARPSLIGQLLASTPTDQSTSWPPRTEAPAEQPTDPFAGSVRAGQRAERA